MASRILFWVKGLSTRSATPLDLSLIHILGAEALRLIGGHQRVDDLIEVAIHDSINFV